MDIHPYIFQTSIAIISQATPISYMISLTLLHLLLTIFPYYIQNTNKRQGYTFKSIISYLWSRLATVLDSICPIIKLLQVLLLIIYIYYFNHDEWYRLAYYKNVKHGLYPMPK